MSRPPHCLPIILLLIPLASSIASGEPATIVIPSRSASIIRSGEAVTDTTTTIRSGQAVTDTTGATACSTLVAPRAGGGLLRSGEASLWRGPGWASRDCWYHRTAPAHHPRPPAPPDQYLWADTMWLMIYLYTYNNRFGCPLGSDYSSWIRSWKGDLERQADDSGRQKGLEGAQPDR